MKKFNKRAMSIASVAAILASIAAMPAFAVESNVYSVSYETLTTAITTEDGNTVPAGAVAVTMSINNNSGFDANTFKLDIEDDFTIMLNEEGSPILEKGNVLNGAMIGVAENDGLLCVTAAMGQSCNGNGELFTVYATTTETSATNFAEVVSTQPVKITETTTATMMVPGTVQPCSDVIDGWLCYYGGDCNNDNLVNSVDASLIMIALENTTPKILDVDEYSKADFFPSVIHNAQPDANGDGYITHFETGNAEDSDAQTILSYAASAGAGLTYDGYGSDTVGQLIQAYRLA